MLDAPCSRIGHIYRKFAPFPNPRKDDFVAKVRSSDVVPILVQCSTSDSVSWQVYWAP